MTEPDPKTALREFREAPLKFYALRLVRRSKSIARKRSSSAYNQTSTKVIVPSIRLYEQNTQNPTILISTYEINDRTRRTVRQRAGATGVQKWPNRQGVRRRKHKGGRGSRHVVRRKGCPAQEARREKLTGTDCTHFSPLGRLGGGFCSSA